MGIKLLVNDPTSASSLQQQHHGPCQNRNGKLFLQFGTRDANNSNSNGQLFDDSIFSEFEHPRLVWTDGQAVTYSLELLDIVSIRSPDPNELKNKKGGTYYPFSNAQNSFFVSTHDGTTLLFEAGDEMQMIQITTALRGIIGRLAKKIVMGENDWLVQMMLASVGDMGGPNPLSQQQFISGGLDKVVEEDVPHAMADVTDHLVGKQTTGLMRSAQERRSRLRSTRQQHNMVM